MIAVIGILLSGIFAYANDGYISKDAQEELGLSVSVTANADSVICSSKLDLLYSKNKSDMHLAFHSANLTAFDNGSSNHTESLQRCNYKIRAQFLPGWQVRLKDPSVVANTSFQKLRSLGDNPVDMASRFTARLDFNASPVLNDALWLSCSSCYEKLTPSRGRPNASLWTACGETTFEIDLILETQVEHIIGSGTAKASIPHTNAVLEWKSCD